MSNDCLFCKIANREIPAKIVYEDDQLLAFQDVNPQAPFHVLIIPRRHISTLNDVQEGDAALVGGLITRAAQIAKDQGHAQDGYRDSVQLQPRRRADGVPHPPTPAGRPEHDLAARVAKRSKPLARSLKPDTSRPSWGRLSGPCHESGRIRPPPLDALGTP